MRNLKLKYLFITAIGISLWSCQKDEVLDENNANENSETQVLYESDDLKFGNIYDSSITYTHKGETLTDVSLINSMLNENFDLDVDDDNRVVSFLTKEENNKIQSELDNNAKRSSAVLTIMRGNSNHNNKWAEHYGWHRKGYFTHNTTTWAHHKYKRPVSTNWVNGKLNKITVINYRKDKRVKRGSLHKNGNWVYSTINKKSYKSFSINGSYYTAHKVAWTN